MRRVLVGDGLPGGREILRILLEHDGWEVSEAATAPEAIKIGSTGTWDLILLDVEVAAFDGHAVMERLRENEQLKECAILAVMGSPRKADCERLMAAGFTDCLGKPVVLNTLRQKLEGLFPSRQAAG